MKTKGSVLLLTVLFMILTACSKEKEEPKPPDKEIEEVGGHTGELPDFRVFTTNESAMVVLVNNCWEKVEETCHLEHQPPQEHLRGIKKLFVEPGQKVNLTLSTSNPSLPKELWSMDFVETDLVQFYEDEESNVETDIRSFLAPQEPGKYYYSIILKWTGDIKGEANYAFSLVVK